MARIEISLEEYNNFKEQIKEQEKVILKMENKMVKLHEAQEILKQELHELVNHTTFIERLFKWKKIKVETNKLIKKLNHE